MALINAVEAERIHQVRLLLSNHSIDINQTEGNGQTALIKSCFMKKKWKALCVANLLIKNGTDVNIKDRDKRTCLSYACILGKEYLVKIFLETGDIAPNTKDVHTFTNLMYAVESGNMSVVGLLLLFLKKYGLSLDDRTSNGFTAYMIALKQGYFDIADLLAKSGASTQTCDFKLFRRSEEWKMMGSSRRRASTAPGVLSTNFETLEWAKQTTTQHQDSLEALKEKSSKTPAVEVYHTLHTRLTGLSEAKLLLRVQSTSDGGRHKDSITQKKLPSISKRKDSITRKSSSEEDEQTHQLITQPPHETVVRNLRYSTKNIIGTLLKESVLTKSQHEDDKERHERTKISKLQRCNNDNEHLLPRIDLLSVGNPSSQDASNIRRCLSSDPSKLRKRSSHSASSMRLRRTSVAS